IAIVGDGAVGDERIHRAKDRDPGRVAPWVCVATRWPIRKHVVFDCRVIDIHSERPKNAYLMERRVRGKYFIVLIRIIRVIVFYRLGFGGRLTEPELHMNGTKVSRIAAEYTVRHI